MARAVAAIRRRRRSIPHSRGGAAIDCGIDVHMDRRSHNRVRAAHEFGIDGPIARERAIAALAARQHGVVTRRQLVEAGLSTAAIDGRVKAHRLRVLQVGVYLVGPVSPPLAREMAAVLACGEGALLSHRSAAVLWQLRPDPSPTALVDVTVIARDRGRRRGIRVHRAQARLPADEATTRRRIPITTPARTLLDLAPELRARELEAALAEAKRRRLTTDRKLLALVARYPGRRGVRALRDLLERDERPALTRSEAEERFLALIRSAELDAPDVNVTVGPYEVDFLWRREALIVEVDGFAYHSDRNAFEGDRRRDADLAARGYTVVRVTWRQIVEAPAAVLTRVAQALARSGSR